MATYQELLTKRCSIRKYIMDEFDAAELQKVIEVLSNVKTLNSCIFSIKIVNHQEFYMITSGLFRINAPHYLVIHGDGTPEGLLNVGFISEQICLSFVGLDIGSVFLGGATIKDKELKGTYAISLAFGKTNEPFRNDLTTIKRKKIQEIAEGNVENFSRVLNNARIAPSAMNYQPWYFVCREQEIDVYRNKNLLRHFKKMQTIDIGIVLSHFLTENVSFTPKEAKKIRGKEYFTSIIFTS